ncbi:MAG: NosD domain-containing protein, partial [Euryarchaeota archaeon]|nr:NosD domain-containing protein [Euryarchaeota archaeon]
MLIKEVNERECKVSLLKLSFLKKVTAILVISALVMFTAVASAGDPPCTCGDICVNETGWWQDGGAFNASGTPIQDAVNNAHSGETICVKDGMYTENVDVNVTNSTIKSENGSTSCIVQAASSGDHAFEVTADYVNVTGFTARGATSYKKAGIYLDDVEHCDVTNNTASNNSCGIYLSSSSNNSLTGNTANSNDGYAIYLFSSSNYNSLTNNGISNNYDGI